MEISGKRTADVELARRALAGDEDCVREFIHRMGCVPRILVAKNRRLGRPLSDDDLSDLVQDTLLAVWRKLGQFDGQAALETWVYRFCHLELMRRLRTLQSVPLPLENPDARVYDRSTGAEAAERDFARIVEGLEHLPEDLAEVLRLKHLAHLTFDQIGDRLALSPNTAKTRYYRGLTQLRKALGEQARQLGSKKRA